MPFRACGAETDARGRDMSPLIEPPRHNGSRVATPVAITLLALTAFVANGPVTAVGVPVQSATLETVLARAAGFIATFVERFSHVVTEERYSQTLHRSGWSSSGPRATMSPLLGAVIGSQDLPERREFRSDLVFIRDASAFGWLVLRDVFEVDGKPVRDREERLTRLLAEPGADARALSARFNIGPGMRTTNTPELTILFLQASLQPRFTFSRRALDRSKGPSTWIVEYLERARPTLVRGDEDQDLPASGRFWIDADSGIVTEAEMVLKPPAVTWTLSTVFRLDAALGTVVPVQMREHLLGGGTEMTATATYGAFRTFTVRTNERLGQ
jgi:hypothetical protein